jgi:hypothetical protein
VTTTALIEAVPVALAAGMGVGGLLLVLASWGGR